MYTMMKVFFVGVLVSIFMAGCEYNFFEKKEEIPRYAKHFDKNANPYKDLQDALKRAKKDGQKVLIEAGGDWCKWCGTFDNFLEDHEDVAKKWYGSFKVMKAYYGEGMNSQSQSLFKQFSRVTETPYFYILDSNATLLNVGTSSQLERGYGYNKQKVLDFIEKNK